MTVIYLLRLFVMIFMGKPKVNYEVKEGSFSMVSSVATLAVLSLLGGIFINYPADFVYATVQQLMGVLK